VTTRSWGAAALRALLVAGVVLPVRMAAAQGAGEHEHHVPAQDAHAGHAAPTQFVAREASGTSWLPDTTPMYGYHRQSGAWDLMLHGNAFAQFLYENGNRGGDQGGSINWFMAMARRPAGNARVGLRGMASLEAWTIPGCGYPDLLATGETCGGEGLHDRQHPHDLIMELAADYDRPLAGSVRWQVYGGLAGEPALGPVSFPHRTSALPNPLAPIGHHWLDATHVTFGVLTAGVYDRRWKVEGSLFNGREPDEDRADLDLGALDSFAGRLWYVPTANLALQLSGGRLREAEEAHAGGPPVDVTRLTASATYHRAFRPDSIWATTATWGRNAESGESSHALVLETNLSFDERDSWFGRLDVVGKPAHDLDIQGSGEVFTVAKLQAGYTRYLTAWAGLKPGIGGSVSTGFVPAALEPVYGSRANLGLAAFFTVRAAVHSM
jgi:hypothetical protein